MSVSHLHSPSSPLITCPRCNEEFPLNAAIAQQLAEPLLARREESLRQEIASELGTKYSGDIETLRAQLKDREATLKENAAEVTKLRTAETSLRKERRKLEEEKEGLEVQQERMRDDIRKEERESAQKKIRDEFQDLRRREDEAHKTRELELTKQIDRMKTQLADAARKGDSSSRQEEGVAWQEVFAEELRERFPNDDISVTARGQAGADVTQHVKVGNLDCGIILWECKRTAKWNSSWPAKLSKDVSDAQAELGVIVSEALPADMDGFGTVERVAVCTVRHAAALATGYREALISVWRFRAANAGRSDVAGAVYDYIATGEFETRYRTLDRAAADMLDQLAKEKRAFAQVWRKRERAIADFQASLHGIATDLIGVGAELPPGAQAELPGAEQLELAGAQE